MSSTDSSAEKRMTGTSERREQIIQRLRQQGSVQVNDLSLLFGVSTVTIRNDLAFLEKQGLAVRAYGGALICDGPGPGTEPSVEDKSSLNTAVKRSIAQVAADLIKPGHRVILDSGTTTFEIARMLRQHTDVIFAHLAAAVGDQRMPILQGDAKAGVGQYFHHNPLHFNRFFLGHGRFSGVNR